MSEQENNQQTELSFHLVVYDKEGNQVATFSCEHIAKACALAIQQTKLHEGFVIVNQENEFLWKYEFQQPSSNLNLATYNKETALNVYRCDKIGNKGLIITPPIKVNFKCTARLQNNGYNDFGSQQIKAIDAPELVEHFIGSDDYYIEFPNIARRWLVYVSKRGDEFLLNF